MRQVMPNLDVDMALMPPVEVPRKRRKVGALGASPCGWGGGWVTVRRC